MTEASPPYEFSSVLVNLSWNEELNRRVYGTFVRQINPEDLAPGGIERDLHITVVFGLHTNDADAVKEIIQGFKEHFIDIKLGTIDYFNPGPASNGNYPLKINVQSFALEAIRKELLENFEATITFPKYEPHITIAYLKQNPNKYIRKEGIGRMEPFSVSEVVFADKMGAQTRIPLLKEI